MESGTKAFVSYVRGYKEHHCRFIFRVQVRGRGCTSISVSFWATYHTKHGFSTLKNNMKLKFRDVDEPLWKQSCGLFDLPICWDTYQRTRLLAIVFKCSDVYLDSLFNFSCTLKFQRLPKHFQKVGYVIMSHKPPVKSVNCQGDKWWEVRRGPWAYKQI